MNNEFPEPKFNLPELKKLQVYKLYKDSTLPTRKNKEDAGLDLRAYTNNQDITIAPGEIRIVCTGVAVKIPEGYAGLIWPKSRSNFLVGGGIVDSGYQGEIMVKIINVSNSPLTIIQKDAIAQLLIQSVETPEVVEVTEDEFYKEKTQRGDDGGIAREYKSSVLVSNIIGID